MAIGSGTPLNAYTGNGVTTVFAYGFTLLDAGDLVVTLDGVETSAYSVSGIGNAAGGDVTFTTAPASGVVVMLRRVIELVRQTEYQANGDLQAGTVNEDFDRLLMAIQGVSSDVSRVVRVPYGETLSELPDAAARANTVMAFDADGDATVSVPASGTAADVLIQLADTATAGKGDASIGIGAVTVLFQGGVTRYASVNAAVAAVGSDVCTLYVRQNTTLAASVTIPATCRLAIDGSAVIALAGYTLTINGPFLDPGTVQCWSGSGTVVFGLGSSDYVRPEWWGAKADAAANGTSGTDSTTALQAAGNAAPPVLASAGNYLFTNLTSPSNKAWYGAGVHATNFICKVGSTGTMFTDQGSAAKIDIQGIAFYGNNCSYTAGFKLGYGGGSQFGTEGTIDVWVRDLPSGFAGIDIQGNVGHASRLLSQDTGGLRLVGAANMVDKAQAYGSKGFTESGVTVGCSLQISAMGALEVEAPASGIVPLYLLGNATIGNIYLAPTAGATHSHLIEIGASATTWAFTLNLGFASGTAPTITNGNIKSGSRYLGGNATGKNYSGEGNYTSENFGQRYHCFTLKVTNSGGTLKHTIATTSGASTSSAPAISGASSTLTTSPTGADNITAMAAGGKIGSAATNTFWFDSRNQSDAVIQMNCGAVLTSIGAALVAVPVVSTLTINGVSRTILGVQFLDAASGAAVALSSLGVGQYVQVTCAGYMAT